MPQPEKTHPLRVKWVKSAIGYSSRQGKVIQGLGLRRLNQVVERPDTPQIRGMIRAVAHLVKILPSGKETALVLIPEYRVTPKTRPTNKTKKVVSKKTKSDIANKAGKKALTKKPKTGTKPLEVVDLKPEEKDTKENISKKDTPPKVTDKKI